MEFFKAGYKFGEPSLTRAIKHGILIFANLGAGLVFQWYIITQLGTGTQTDALFASLAIPQILLAVISGSLTHTLVPVFSGQDADQLHKDGWLFFILVGASFALIAAVLILSVPLVIPFTVPGFSAEVQELTSALTQINLFSMVFVAANGVQLAVYYARHQYIWPECVLCFANVSGLLLLIFFLPIYGVAAAAWISVLRSALPVLLLLRGLGKPVWPTWNGKAVGTIWLRLKPLLIGATYYKSDLLIDRILLSTATSGSLSVYYLAQQIYSIVSQVINKAISAPVVSTLSKLHKADDQNGFRDIYYRKLKQVGTIALIGILILYLTGNYFLTLFIGHGSFSIRSVNELWIAMICLSGVLVGGTMGNISSAVYYATGNTRALTGISVVTYTIYIPCKVASFYFWGMIGLAIATSIYYVIDLLVQIYYIDKRYII